MKNAVVLGGYGFIGSACVAALKADGFHVTGVGRSASSGQRCDPSIPWLTCDLAHATADEIAALVADADVVINAAGALQDGAKDHLTGIHVDLIQHLVNALEGRSTRLVQISAVGVSDTSDLPFLSTKAQGDALLLASDVDCVVLRPSLVIGAQAYGGTAVLRALAGIPVIGPKVFAKAPMQVVHVQDVAEAALLAAKGAGSREVYDITSDPVVSFDDLVKAVRQWQGFGKWRLRIPVPQFVMAATGKLADGLSHLGWRSPMRSTALQVMKDGVVADGAAWHAQTGQEFRALPEILTSLHAGTQERWFARMFLFLPLTIGCLSLFWLLSGLMGLIQFQSAREVLTARGSSGLFAFLAVAGGALVDILLGAFILVRRWTRLASLSMFLVATSYIIGSFWLAPDLWLDPLGAMVKTLPAAVLCLLPYLFLEDR